MFLKIIRAFQSPNLFSSRVFYACTDEFISYCTRKNRKPVDVLIDTAGGLTALTVIYIVSIFEAFAITDLLVV